MHCKKNREDNKPSHLADVDKALEAVDEVRKTDQEWILKLISDKEKISMMSRRD